MMGLLSDLAIFQAPEAVLERQLQTNPFHPFQLASGEGEDETKVFVYTSRHTSFYFYLVLTIASFLFIIIWPAAGNDSEYVVFGVAVFLMGVYLVLETWPQWSIVLEPDSHHYSVYHGSHLTVSQHCHNIYVRLLCEKTSSRSPQYQLVLDGWGLETTIHLTRKTTNKKKLRHLAQELTSNLQINFFDSHNSSKHHIIRHTRPFTNSGRPLETEIHEE